MGDEHSVSRRASLKSIGVMGAAMVLSGTAADARQAAPKPATADKDKKVNVVEVAVDRMAKGHSWAQSVFSAVAEQMGMDYQTAVKASCGFGGGMYLGSVCGAVTGAFMAIGLKHGGVGMQQNIKTALIVRQFADKFKAQNKSINCTDLTGIDLSKVDLGDPVALNAFYKAAQEKGVFARCQGYVKDAATIVNELVNT